MNKDGMRCESVEESEWGVNMRARRMKIKEEGMLERMASMQISRVPVSR